ISYLLRWLIRLSLQCVPSMPFNVPSMPPSMPETPRPGAGPPYTFGVVSDVPKRLSRNAYCLMGGYDGLKFLFIVNKKLTGTKMPLFCRVNAKACSTS
ncbi:MAG: hypothetical protein QOJ51_6629, partial [Acidobacteriaceae bacterium]|nr:hypothetical protein [Acidobacteriaceae bacterium]